MYILSLDTINMHVHTLYRHDMYMCMHMYMQHGICMYIV